MSPEVALAVAQALLRHPSVEAVSNSPTGRWLHELIDLVGKDHIGCTKATSQGAHGGSSWAKARLVSQRPVVSSTTGSPDLHTHINKLWAEEDTRTSLE